MRGMEPPPKRTRRESTIFLDGLRVCWVFMDSSGLDCNEFRTPTPTAGDVTLAYRGEASSSGTTWEKMKDLISLRAPGGTLSCTARYVAAFRRRERRAAAFLAVCSET